MVIEFIEGIEWIDCYITDEALYVMERLTDLDEVRDYSTVRKIVFNCRTRDESNKRVTEEEESIAYKGTVDVRIFCDETVRDALRFLGRAIGFVKISEFRLLANIIVDEWIREEEHNKKFGVRMNVGSDYGTDFARFGNTEYITFSIRRDLWNEMKDIGKRKALNMEECLKLAVIRFLERRYDICREFLM